LHIALRIAAEVEREGKKKGRKKNAMTQRPKGSCAGLMPRAAPAGQDAGEKKEGGEGKRAAAVEKTTPSPAATKERERRETIDLKSPSTGQPSHHPRCLLPLHRLKGKEKKKNEKCDRSTA